MPLPCGVYTVLSLAECIRALLSFSHACSVGPPAACSWTKLAGVAAERLQGSHQDSIVVLVYGLSIYIAGDLLFMAFGDAL